MKTITLEERETLATVADTSVGYLYQLSGGHRLCGHLLAKKIHAATHGAVTVHDLRPDIFGEATKQAA